MTRNLVALATAGVLCAACASGGGSSTAGSPSRTPTPGPTAYHVDLDPAQFSADVTNPWFPLKPGTTLVYEGRLEEGPGRDVVVVSDETQEVGGVRCRVVLDRVYVGGVLTETTRDLYAQDRQGDVWYFGEDTASLGDDLTMESTEGTWHTGEAGALPGIVMTATPTVGDSHRQEYYAGHAEDFYEVVSTTATVTTPYKTFTGAVQTKEWTPLEPDVLDAKYYAKGVGEVAEQTVKGPTEKLALVSVTYEAP